MFMYAITLVRVLPLMLVAAATGATQEGCPVGSVGIPGAELVAYRIGPGDVLQIDVWKEPDASVPSTTVRPDGKISIPLLGELQASGLLPTELENTLTEKYREFIRAAHVRVILRETNSQKIYMVGEVRREGSIKLSAPLTVLQALAEAGGVTDYAKRKRIRILRTVNGRQIALPFDYDAVLDGQNTAQNITLLPNDTVVVPR